MVFAIAVALVGHALAILLFLELGGLTAFEPMGTRVTTLGARSSSFHKGEDQPLQIENLVNELDVPDAPTPAEKKREEEVKKEEDAKNPHGQVVDLAKPTVEERPDKADYLAEYDSKVDHQTRGATGRGQAGARAAFSPPEGSPDVREPMPAQPGQKSAGKKPGRPGPLAMRDLPRRHAESAAEGPLATREGELGHAGSDCHERAPAPPDHAAGEQGAAGQRAEASGHPAAMPGLPGERRPSLTPTPDQLARAIGKGSGSMDYLKDLDAGESTALNAKKWKFAPFFNRVKRAVANEWHPEVVYVQHDPSGNVYGVKDRVKVLRVHLKQEGKIAYWNVLEASGIGFFDDEAIAAFQKAQPFPNPPKELVDSDGLIHFNFAFIFELSGRTSMKVFKY